ncbi:MAG: isopentenyl phosphate kinase [Euryarchaeota archaeon]|nr:isopentenyl phosphate kinase [Euryarchaeota archaeon]
MPPTILKIGGSVLTEKTDTPTPKPSAIERCAAEIASYHPSADSPMILVHGAGSFGHPQAKKHDSPGGFTNLGIIEIHRSVTLLNELIVDALIEDNVPAAPVHPFGCTVAEGARISEMQTAPIALMLARGIVPVLHGDVVMDSALGASIISGDQIVAYLAVLFGASRIGFGTAVDGVIADGKVVSEITPGTFGAVRPHIHGSEGTDVTGGMLGKVRELLDIDIDSYIFSAAKPGVIAGFLSGKEPGTRITKTENRPVVDLLETS